MKLVYGVKDKPAFGANLVFAIQQLLAIMTATLVVPVITNNSIVDKFGGEVTMMSPVAALVGAGLGTLVYAFFTKFRSPVFLGSSFAFLGSMAAAFAGAATVAVGYVGLIIGAILAGLVYVLIAILVKFVGVGWLNKLMPTVVIGPTVALIGLSLAGNAVGDIQKGNVTKKVAEWQLENVDNVMTAVEKTVDASVASPLVTIAVGLFTLVVIALCATFGKKMAKMIPFIIGILAGYALSAILTAIGYAANVDAIKILNIGAFQALVDGGVGLHTFFTLPDFTFVEALGGFDGISGEYFATIAVAYIPVAFVVFAEHVADHKNISSIIEHDLLEDPGLSNTLLGDGVGSMVGALFGGCPNTTYGESVGCVAISGNASVYTIITSAILAIIIAFIAPFVAFVDTIPSCVMGGVCMALYGFIAVSGLKMVQKVDLEKNRNLFVVSSILIAGIGGLEVEIGAVKITNIACALIIGIVVNAFLSKADKE